jgi:hypothetical protein
LQEQLKLRGLSLPSEHVIKLKDNSPRAAIQKMKLNVEDLQKDVHQWEEVD